MVKRRQPEKSVSELINDLDLYSTYAKKNAIVQLATLKAQKAGPRLRQLLMDDEASIRACSAWALGEIGLKEATLDLLPLVRDMDTEVRRACVGALGDLADPRALEALRSVTIDSDRWVGEMAIKALAKIVALQQDNVSASSRGKTRMHETEVLELKS